MLEMIGVGPFITLPLVIAAAGYRLSVVGLGAGRGHRRRRRPGVGGTGRGISRAPAVPTHFCAKLWTRPRRQLAQLSLRLAAQLFRAALHRLGLHRAFEFSGLVLAGPRDGANRRLTRSPLLQLRCGRRLPSGDGAALSQSQFHHAACLGICLPASWRRSRASSSPASPTPQRTEGGTCPPSPAQSVRIAVGGLAQATLIATYDYWGYYNITFLGSEVRQPERTIPRAILLSVLFVSALYVAMNLAALPSVHDAAVHASQAAAPLHLQLVADIAGSAFGVWAGRIMAALIMWTAFASVFSLLLGYSRVPYAAARDGNYFRFLVCRASAPRHSAPIARSAGSCCGRILFLFASASDHNAGDHAHPAAVFSAASWGDATSSPAARSRSPIPNAVVSAPSACGDGGICIHSCKSH